MAHEQIELRHGMASIEPGVALHYVSAGAGDRTIVLLHGFPQTWQEWRHVIPMLVGAGYRAVAPDYRGAGHSSRPLAERGKLAMPVLAVGGQTSTTGPLMADMMREVAADVTELRVPNAAHWIAEENPEALVEGLQGFIERR